MTEHQTCFSLKALRHELFQLYTWTRCLKLSHRTSGLFLTKGTETQAVSVVYMDRMLEIVEKLSDRTSDLFLNFPFWLYGLGGPSELDLKWTVSV